MATGFQLKSLITFVLTLWFVSMFLFLCQSLAPHDPVEQALGVYSQDENVAGYTDKDYISKAKELGLDLPHFYFSILPQYYPNDWHKIVLPSQRALAKKLMQHGHTWTKIEKYLSQREELKRNNLEGLLDFESALFNGHPFNSDSALLNELIQKKNTSTFPTIRWHGTNNRYHQWVTSLFGGAKIYSTIDGKPVWEKIKNAILWSLFPGICVFLLVFSFGIFLGYKQVERESSIWTLVAKFFDLLYSMPIFWLSTLLLIFFTSSDYGSWTNIFPSTHSISFVSDSPFVNVISNFKNLILPILCASAHGIGYVSAHTANSLRNELAKPHILYARQKGNSTSDILKKHGLKNAMIPIVTLFTEVLPNIILGSLVIEVIFNIPGMSRLIYKSVLLADWNVVFPVVFITALLNIFAFWLADTLYKRFDPRINLSNS